MTPSTEPPRVVVISEVIPQTVYAGNILLFRLFNGYPADRLLVVGPRPERDATRLPSNYRSIKQIGARLDRTRLAKVPRTLDAFGLRRVPLRRVRHLVGDFNADIVLTVAQTLSMYRAAFDYARFARLPLVIIVHDVNDQFEEVFRFAQARRRRLNRSIFRAAEKRLCVSPEMAGYIGDLHGVRCDVLYPNRSEDLRPRPSSDAGRLTEEPSLTLGYAGSLAYGYGRRIAELAPVLEKTGTKLRIFSRDRLRHASTAISERGFAPAEVTWQHIRAECDALLLPYHSLEYALLYRTHFPSKLPEYLALRMPVVIIGPAYATGVVWGRRNPDAAMTLVDPDSRMLEEALAHLRCSATLRINLAEAAYAAGQRDFDPRKIREAFCSTLAEVARR